VPFRVVVSRYVEEEGVALDPEGLVRAHALGKAREVAARCGVLPGDAVLGADTAVVRDGHALGKPRDAAEARSMLASLAGREHVVMTAVALVAGLQPPRGEPRTGETASRFSPQEEVRCDATRVRFRTLSPDELDRYVGTGEWRDRAGGYAIQGAGAAIVEHVEGEYTTVVGLPLPTVAEMLTGWRSS